MILPLSRLVRRLAGPVLFLQLACFAWGRLDIPALFGDHMVLQAGKELAFWGWGTTGDRITVRFVDREGQAKAEAAAVVGSDKKWRLQLPPLSAGSAGSVDIQSASGEQKRIEDVVVGDVWLGSGQSNMEYKVGASNMPREMVMAAEKQARGSDFKVRFFNVKKKAGEPAPLEEVEGEWVIVTPENVGQFSAVGWYFAQILREKLEVPIGMIITCWGGTPVEAWMSREMLESTAASKEIWERHEKLLASYTPEKVKRLQDEMKAWQKANPTLELQRKNAKTKPQYPYWPTSSRVPVRLYNGMLHGVIPYTLQGFIWYQGEANASRPDSYGELIQTMVKGWRKAWGEDLPFYYVELASYQARQKDPVQEPSWAFIREAQAEVLKLSRTGVATAIDVGLADNVHPPFKETVGRRLAGLALRDVHGQGGLVESPQLAGVSVEGDKVRVSLGYAEGLHAKETGEIRGFAICGADKQWKWAHAKVEGGDVIVWNGEIPRPVAVRYGWANNPVMSLVNGAGLPLRPFRTDKESLTP